MSQPTEPTAGAVPPVTLIDGWEAAECRDGNVLVELWSMGAQVRLLLPPSVAGPLAGSIRLAAQNAVKQRVSGGSVIDFAAPKRR